VLRIMNDPANRAENRGADGDGEQEQAEGKENTSKAHEFSKYL
jgi:hypothetical protein